MSRILGRGIAFPVHHLRHRPAQWPATVDETTTTSETADRVLTEPRSTSETTTTSEEAIRSQVLGRELTEDLVPEFEYPFITTVGIYDRTFAETVTPSDGVDRVVTAFRRFTEGLHPDDMVSRSLVLGRDVPEAPGEPAELATWVHAFPREINETVTPVESITRTLALARSLSQAVTGTETVQQALTRIRTAEFYIVTSEQVTRTLLLPRSSGETAPASDATEQAWTAGRTAGETASASDTVARIIDLARSTSEAAAPTDALEAVQALARALAESAPASDAILRGLTLSRGLSEAPGAVTESLARALDLHRAATETLASPSTVAYRGFAWVRTADAGTVTPVDVVTFLTLDLTLPPRATITSVSTDRISRNPGYDVVQIEFSFDQPVTAWVVRVGSSGPYDGDLVTIYDGAAVSSGQADVLAQDLQGGSNQVDVYGRSLRGVWSLREPV